MSDPQPRPASALEGIRRVALAQQLAGLEWVRERELTRSQGFVLAFLQQNPRAIQRDIAEASGTTAANISGVLQVLERRGLVARVGEPGNARVKLVRITPEGEALVAGFDASVAASDEAILAPLTDDERAELLRLLAKITAPLPDLPRPESGARHRTAGDSDDSF